MKKKIISVLTASTMIALLIPILSFASETNNNAKNILTDNEEMILSEVDSADEFSYVLEDLMEKHDVSTPTDEDNWNIENLGSEKFTEEVLASTDQDVINEYFDKKQMRHYLKLKIY